MRPRNTPAAVQPTTHRIIVCPPSNCSVLVGADTLAAYGSLARYEGVARMQPVGVANDTLLAAGGDYSDYQQMLKISDARATTEYAPEPMSRTSMGFVVPEPTDFAVRSCTS